MESHHFLNLWSCERHLLPWQVIEASQLYHITERVWNHTMVNESRQRKGKRCSCGWTSRSWDSLLHYTQNIQYLDFKSMHTNISLVTVLMLLLLVCVCREMLQNEGFKEMTCHDCRQGSASSLVTNQNPITPEFWHIRAVALKWYGTRILPITADFN